MRHELATGILLLLLAPPASGQILPAGPEIPAATSASFQTAPAVASDASGGTFVVAWQRQVAGGWGIYARQYTWVGNDTPSAGPEFRVDTQTTGCQQLPAVAADAVGNFVVAWQSDQDPGGGAGIYARRFNRAGSPVDTVEFRVPTTVAGNQTQPAVAMAPDGRFLIAWQSDSQSVGQGWDVAAQAYTAGGTATGGEVTLDVTTAGAQLAPRSAWLAGPTPGFAVAWQSGPGIFVRRLGVTGAAVDAAERQVNTTSTGLQRSPAIASDPSGNYLVVWESLAADGLDSRIRVRRFQGATALAADQAIDLSPAASRQHSPAVASDALGNWAIAWDSGGEDGSGTALVAAELSNRLVPTGTKVVLDTVTGGDQAQAAVASGQGGRLFAAWRSLTAAADGAQIAARPVRLTGGFFFTLPPCRLIDTRNANGPLGGPVLSSGVPRVFPVAGSCGIPATAKVLSVNVTAVGAGGAGFLSLYPGDAPTPGTSAINFSATRPAIANNAQIVLSRDGMGTLAAVASLPGTVHLILDVNGYYQ